MTRRPRPRLAFTLLEVLLATAMVAVLAAALYTAMSIGFRARDRARAQLHAARGASVALELAEQDLRSVLPPRGILAGAFTGTHGGTQGATGAANDTLDFYVLGRDATSTLGVGNADTPGLSEGIRHVQLALRGETVPTEWVRRVQRNLLAATAEQPTEEVLARGVRSFKLRYFDGLNWREEWDSTAEDNSLPLAVEMTLELDEPAPTDAARPYRLTQIVALSCGQAVASAGGTGVPLE